MSIDKFCIKHRVTTILAFVIISIFGIVYTGQLEMSLLPNMEFPAAYVFCYYNGATPSDMEQLVTRPLESAIMSVPGVESIQSNSSDSITTVQITYVEDTNVDIAATKLREKFDSLSLPDGCTSPSILNINISELLPSAIIALMGDDLASVQDLAENTVGPALERIDGVASVSVSGGVNQQIAVEVDASRAAGYGLSNSYISQILVADNLLFPGGEVQNGSKSLTVSTSARFQSVEDVANLILPLQTGGTVRLSEVANVALETTDQDNIAQMNGTPCVILQVSKQSGANEVSTAKAVDKAMKELSEKHDDIVYAVPYLASDYINIVVSSAIENIILGVALAAIVVFLFLRRFGATLAICVSMPVCILTVFVLMNVCDLTLNLMSLGGIAMGVGMIVDNSIVVLENIYRYSAEGHDRMTSCVDGTKEVILSLMASTLTTVAVFLPLGLANGLAGMIFKDFCLTIAFLILASLVISITLVPLLCYFLLDETKAKQMQLTDKKESKFEQLGQRFNAWYTKTLGYFVHHLKQGVLVSVGVLAVFVLVCFTARIVLLPDMDMGMVSVSVSTPTGSELKDTAAIADRIVDIAYKEVPEIEMIYYTSEEESASVNLTLVGRSERSRTSVEVANALREQLNDIAGCEISVSSSDMTQMMSGSGISVGVSGTDYETLKMIADDLTQQISALPDAVDVTSSISRQVPQVEVTMNRSAASQYGLTAATVGAAVRSELTGSTATTVTINNKEIDVVVRGDGVSSKNLDALRSTPITTPMGGTVPLSAVANVDVVLASQSITRVDQSRRVTISGSSVSGDTPAITRQIRGILDNYTLPEGYTAEIGGEYSDMVENFSDLGLALLVAVGLVYFVLASQFESFVMPIIVMMIIPIAFGGALFMLPVTGRDISMISMVALIMLAGTVVNASIILVDYIKQRRERGESREDAILHACPLRIRPVLMTTLTTILALVPLGFGIGESNEMMSDMGVAMMSGMAFSTVITLFFTPVYYCVIDDIGKKKRKLPELPEQAE